MLDDDYKLNYEFFLEQYRNYGNIYNPEVPYGYHAGSNCIVVDINRARRQGISYVKEPRHIDFILKILAETEISRLAKNPHETYFLIDIFQRTFWVSIPLFYAFLKYKIDMKLDTPSKEDIIYVG